MSSSNTLSKAIHEWMHVFMRRSMVDFSHYARDTGMSMPQFVTLINLHRKGIAGVSDVGDDLGVTSAAASQMIERLVQIGMLERSEDPHDRRVKQIALTPRGRELLENGMQVRAKWLDDLARALTPEQQETIITALDLLTQAARETDLQTVKD